jgi:hypothetical chaperone protein
MVPAPRNDSIGIDFGTTNSSVALARADGSVALVRFPALAGGTESFRSVLYLEEVRAAGRRQVKSFTGLAAIAEYLGAGGGESGGERLQGRLIQSLKSYLASRSLTGTEVFGRRYTLEDMISRMLTDLRLGAEAAFGVPIREAVVGRPVRFVGAETETDGEFALGRLREAFLRAGFERVEFEMEPVGAAYAYEAQGLRDELILIGDFGGGTSDFSMLRVGPVARAARLSHDNTGLVGNAGLGLAGDAFDARIVRRLVSPALGMDSNERDFGGGLNGAKLIPAVPAWIYANLERWHYLSFLKTRNVTEILRGARVRADAPEKVAALQTLIEEDLGYQLHQAVERLKIALSRQEVATFRFNDGSLEIKARVERAEFEEWIADELEAIAGCVDGLLAACGVRAGEVDRVFLTGGTSFVPAVRRIFEERFGAEKVQAGGEFTSVAVGLALSALGREQATTTTRYSDSSLRPG